IEAACAEIGPWSNTKSPDIADIALWAAYSSLPFFFTTAGQSALESIVAFLIAAISVGPCNGLVKNALAPDASLRSRMPASSNAVMTIVGIFLLMRLR